MGLPIRTDLLEKLLKLMPEEQREEQRQNILALSEDLEQLEQTLEARVTQNGYGAYLLLVTDVSSVLSCLAAGGNLKGILTAATINGVKLPTL